MTLGNSMREIAVVVLVLTISFLCGVSTGSEEFPITVNPGAQHFPKIHGDMNFPASSRIVASHNRFLLQECKCSNHLS